MYRTFQVLRYSTIVSKNLPDLKKKKKKRVVRSPSWRSWPRWPEIRSRSSETAGRSTSCPLHHCWGSNWDLRGSQRSPGLQVSEAPLVLLGSLELVPKTVRHTWTNITVLSCVRVENFTAQRKWNQKKASLSPDKPSSWRTWQCLLNTVCINNRKIHKTTSTLHQLTVPP